MASTEIPVKVNRELELTIDVTESGVVKVRLTGGAVKMELRAGDQVVLMLEPSAPDTVQPVSPGGTWNSSDGGTDRNDRGGVDAQRTGRDFLGGAAPAPSRRGMGPGNAGVF